MAGPERLRQAEPEKHGFSCSYYQKKAGTNVGAVLIVQVGLEVWDQTAEIGGFTARSEDRCSSQLRIAPHSMGHIANSSLSQGGLNVRSGWTCEAVQDVA